MILPGRTWLNGAIGRWNHRVEDVLLVIDAEDTIINDIDEMVLDNLAAGCTAPGVLGASIRYGASSFWNYYR